MPPLKRPRTSVSTPAYAHLPLSKSNASPPSAPHTELPKSHSQPIVPGQPSVFNFTYAPFRTIDINKVFSSPTSSQGMARVQIAVQHLTSSNPAIAARSLWGYHRYTADSDLVAVLYHVGLFKPRVNPPTDFEYLSVLVNFQRHVSGESPSFEAAVVNGYSSRSWSSKYEGAAMTIESLAYVSADIAEIFPPRTRRKTTLRTPRLIPWKQIDNAKVKSNSTANPGLHGASRGAGSRDGKVEARRAAVGTDGALCFDLLNEPCLVFDVKEVWCLQNPTSVMNRLRREVLYVEDSSRRFEISAVDVQPAKSRSDEDDNSEIIVNVRFALVSEETMRRLCLPFRFNNDGATDDAVPLCVKDVKVIAEKISWNDLVWDTKGVTVLGEWYPLSRLSFRKRQSKL